MDLNFEPGMYVVLASMIIFYLRIAQLRGRKRRLEREAMLARSRKGAKKGAPLPARDRNAPPFNITSWPLVVVATVLMLMGLAARGYDFFPQLMRDYWWVLTSGGVLLFIFCFKV